MTKIQRALLSVSDKTGLVPFAKVLADAGIELISTGGTAKSLREAGLPVRDLSDYTGFPEMLDGRVKTLHPKVHGGLLYLRGNPAHEAAAEEQGIRPIDLVVVNLYPFEKTITRPGVTLEEAIENIDIGGPAMLRSAAKNHEHVTVLMDPADYPEVAAQIQAQGHTTPALRRTLAMRVFARTSAYDATIASHLVRVFGAGASYAAETTAVVRKHVPGLLPSRLVLDAAQVQTLRYGENPHQQAALYGRFREYFQQVHGKELSYNNLLDLSAATQLVAEFTEAPPTVAILKHTNPCGVGQAQTLREAWEKALATDRQAPFGGVIAANRPLDLPGAEAIAEIFSELVIAPGFDDDALALLTRKKNLRLIRMLKDPRAASPWVIRGVGAESYLLQQPDLEMLSRDQLRVVTQREPTADEIEAMLFGWRVVKHVKSNAIVFAARDRTLGIGAGQMSRVDACRLAVWKAGQAGLSLENCAVCSDAFFPFPDGLEVAAEAGATAAIQPGGSVRDDDVIAAADKHGLAMAFTGIRHFRH